MIVDSPADVLAIIGIATGILGGLLWIIRAQAALSRQFKPNHGHSLRDSVDRIERDTREVRVRLDQHIDNHDK